MIKIIHWAFVHGGASFVIFSRNLFHKLLKNQSRNASETPSNLSPIIPSRAPVIRQCSSYTTSKMLSRLLRNSITNFPKNHPLGFLCVEISKTNCPWCSLQASLIWFLEREKIFERKINLLLFETLFCSIGGSKKPEKALESLLFYDVPRRSCLQSIDLFGITFLDSF